MTALQIPDDVRALYDHPGPFATVYLDATCSTEDGAHEVDLRWRSLRDRLRGAAADEATLDAVGEAVLAGTGIAGPHGQVLVAAGGEVLLQRVLPEPPQQVMASWSALPDLLPCLAQSAPREAYVLVVADRTGAEVSAVPADMAAAGLHPKPMSVEGSAQYPVHKRGADQWDERHFQNRVDNSWEANARDVAEVAARQAGRIAADVVVVAGDKRARTLIEADLAAALPPSVEVADVRAGGRADGASGEALEAAVADVLLRRTWRRRRELLDHLRQNIGRGTLAAAGVADVLAALRRSQVDTVVLSDDRSSPLRAWFGPEPLQVATTREDVRAFGVAEPREERFDAALVRAVAGSGAKLVITPNGHDYLREGIGALLRYVDPATPPP